VGVTNISIIEKPNKRSAIITTITGPAEGIKELRNVVTLAKAKMYRARYPKLRNNEGGMGSA
jgi:hypothetical protein